MDYLDPLLLFFASHRDESVSRANFCGLFTPGLIQNTSCAKTLVADQGVKLFAVTPQRYIRAGRLVNFLRRPAVVSSGQFYLNDSVVLCLPLKLFDTIISALPVTDPPWVSKVPKPCCVNNKTC